jgi:hypothetical protein
MQHFRYAYLIKHHAMKTDGEIRDIAPPIFHLALDGGEWSIEASAALPSKNESYVPIWQEAKWVLVLVGTLWGREKSVALPGIEPRPSCL